jgi:hypothetical protein
VIGPDDSYSFIELPQVTSLDFIKERPAREQHRVIRPGSADEICRLTGCFVLAMDLGFSKSKKSCGLAWKNGQSGRMETDELTFGRCADKVCSLLRCNHNNAAVLIIEAPLSGLFGEEGNPVGRGDFERRDPNLARAATRYWYSGPGAAMCLAAAFFLREVVHRFRENPCGTPHEVVLYEGFITFKSKPTDHLEDAKRLLGSFFCTSCPIVPLKASSRDSVLSILDVIGGATTKSVAPAIIAPTRCRA